MWIGYAHKCIYIPSVGVDYIQSALGSSCVEVGEIRLVNEQECREAARSLNKNFRKTVHGADYPSGCYYRPDTQNVGFNEYLDVSSTHPENSENGGLCKIGECKDNSNKESCNAYINNWGCDDDSTKHECKRSCNLCPLVNDVS